MALLCCVIGLAGCASSLSNTGYEGTWTAERDNETSRIEIRNPDDGCQFRWSLTSTDGTREVRGEWDGRSREYRGGSPVAEYRFRCWMDPETGRLKVECSAEGLHYVDFLVLENDGLVLWSYTEEMNGEVFAEGERPRRRFVKTEDPVRSGN